MQDAQPLLFERPIRNQLASPVRRTIIDHEDVEGRVGREGPVEKVIDHDGFVVRRNEYKYAGFCRATTIICHSSSLSSPRRSGMLAHWTTGRVISDLFQSSCAP